MKRGRKRVMLPRERARNFQKIMPFFKNNISEYTCSDFMVKKASQFGAPFWRELFAERVTSEKRFVDRGNFL